MASTIIALMLLSAAPEATQAGDARPETPASKMICRSSAETGSRLRRTRVCMTSREWDDRQRAEARELQRGSTIIGGNPE